MEPTPFSQIIIMQASETDFYVHSYKAHRRGNGAESCQQNGTSLTCVLLVRASKRICDNTVEVKTVVGCWQGSS